MSDGTEDLRLQAVSAETLRALSGGRRDWNRLEPGLPRAEWPADDTRVLGYRMAALDRDASAAPYLLHLIVDGDGRLLGRVGCHEAPDEGAAVEIGYFVVPEARGRGVAGRAVDLFLSWLAEVGVRRVRASVRPDNVVSRRILEARGFVEVGVQVDEEDGPELVYERPLLPDRPAQRSDV